MWPPPIVRQYASGSLATTGDAKDSHDLLTELLSQLNPRLSGISSAPLIAGKVLSA